MGGWHPFFLLFLLFLNQTEPMVTCAEVMCCKQMWREKVIQNAKFGSFGERGREKGDQKWMQGGVRVR